MYPPPDGIFNISARFSLLHTWSEFYLSLQAALKQFDKRDRHGLGARLDEGALNVLDLLLLASNRRAKSRLLALDKLDRELAREKILVRLAHHSKMLKDGRYANLERKLITMGNMTGGWIRKERKL